MNAACEAARPSIPSMKLKALFSQTSASSPGGRSSSAVPSSPMPATFSAQSIMAAAAPNCPSSRGSTGSARRSSAYPSAAMTSARANTSSQSGCTAPPATVVASAATQPATMPAPPPVGVAMACELRAPGTSRRPTRSAQRQ